MRILKFIFSIALIVSITLLYTHQKIEAMRISYEIKEKELYIDKLLDRKEQLEYNVARLKTPTYLELQLAKEDIKLVLPERWQVLDVTAKKEVVCSSLPLFVRDILKYISLGQEAQATPAKD